MQTALLLPMNQTPSAPTSIRIQKIEQPPRSALTTTPMQTKTHVTVLNNTPTLQPLPSVLSHWASSVRLEDFSWVSPDKPTHWTFSPPSSSWNHNFASKISHFNANRISFRWASSSPESYAYSLVRLMISPMRHLNSIIHFHAQSFRVRCFGIKYERYYLYFISLFLCGFRWNPLALCLCMKS